MKGINVRKIAALTGAAVLGFSAVAMADVVFGSTQLVDQNGQPTVKIVVGSKAAVSDGVAAANIAAKIANEAYKSSTLTASVSGTPTCTVGAGVSGAGTCSILESSKSVTLEVNVPGTVAGTHTFKTLITDSIDKTLENRNWTLSEDNYTSDTTAGDTSGTTTSPLRGAGLSAYQAVNLYRIGSSQFSGFADFSVVDNNAGSASYTQEQAYWVGSKTYSGTNGAGNNVKYDSTSGIKDVVVDKYNAMVYSTKFSGNDYGIPVCTGDLNSNTTDDWTSCGAGSNSRTDRHRVKIKFMGSEWIISSMTNPSGNFLNSSTSVYLGGQVKLAKEAKYGIINVGQVLDAGTFKVRLSDISVAVGAENKHPAIIDILDANEAVVGQVQVDPDTTYTFTQSGTGNTVKIHVYKTAPGFTLNAKWAEMAIYSDEITLKDNNRYNLISSSDTDKDFKVSVLWKNRDYTSATASSSSGVADSLRELVIYNIDSFSEKTKSGDVFNFLKSKPTFKVTMNGVDLTDDDYQALTYTGLSSNEIRIAPTAGDVACPTTGYTTYNARFIEIKTSGATLLGGGSDGMTGDYMFEKVYFDPVGLSGNVSSIVNATQNISLNISTQGSNSYTGYVLPKLFWKASGRDCWNWDGVNYTTTGAGTAVTANGIKFNTAGDNSAAQGGIYFLGTATENVTGVSGATYTASLVLQEDAGKYGTASNNAVYVAVPVITNNTAYDTFRFKPSDSTTDQSVYYRGLGTTSYSSYVPQFVSERGTKVTSVGTSDIASKVAKKLAHVSFTFALSDTSTATTGEEYTLKVGDSKVFGGVTVKVKAIDATAGSCSVLGPGGTPACTVDSSSLAAVIQPDNSGSVEVSMPYALKSNLVVMDAQAPSAGVVVSVGGPLVNTVTAAALQGSDVTFDAGAVVVKEVGNTIVVAGASAADTMSAADQFIAGVKRQ